MTEMFLCASSWPPINSLSAVRIERDGFDEACPFQDRLLGIQDQRERNRVNIHRLTSHSGVGPLAAQWSSVPVIGRAEPPTISLLMNRCVEICDSNTMCASIWLGKEDSRDAST
jgi:hypothetical protein